MHGMNGDQMMGGPIMMFGMGLVWLLAVIALVLLIFAAVKYLRN